MVGPWSLIPFVSSCVALVAGDHVLTGENHDLSARFTDGKGRWNMSFYHVNDVHAHLDKFVPETGDDCNSTSPECYGGSARLKTLITKGRKVHKDSLLISMGDEFTGTGFFSYYSGLKIADTMNMMGFDVMVLGNHEFDRGSYSLAQFLTKLNFPVLGANIHTPHPKIRDKIGAYHIFPEHKLAVIGVTTNQTKISSSPDDDTFFSDPIKTALDTVDYLRDTKGVNRFAAITHIGFDNDKRLAAESNGGLYLIMGGHSHTPLGPMRGAEDEYPYKATNKKGETVYIVQAYQWGEWLGYIDVAFEADGKILDVSPGPIQLTEEVERDPELQEQIDGWRKEYEEHYAKIAGRTESYLNHTDCKQAECVLGNVVADAMFGSGVKHTKPGHDLPAFAMINGGGVRASIPIGNVTYGHVDRSFPFSEEIVHLNMTGQEIWDVFAGILRRAPLNDSSVKIEYFVQVSSQVRIRWNRTNEKKPTVGELSSLTISGKPIEMDKTYKVVSLKFVTKGGDGFFCPGRFDIQKVENLTDAVLRYFDQHNPLTPRGIEARLSATVPAGIVVGSEGSTWKVGGHRATGKSWTKLYTFSSAVAVSILFQGLNLPF